LDQAIAHADLAEGGPLVTAAQVRDMLGLSDRGATRRLLGLLLEGEAAPMLEAVREQHDLGVEPQALMRGLLEIVHAVTIAKAGRGSDDPAQSAEEQGALADWAAQLGFAALHRLWQLLLKGHEEVAASALPLEACEMALLRIVHAATLPDPGELARMLREGGGIAAAPARESHDAPKDEGTPMPSSFAALVELVLKDKRDGSPMMGGDLHDTVGLVRYAPPELAIRPKTALDANFTQRLALRLGEITGKPWKVVIGDGPAEPTLWEQEQAQMAAQRQIILDTPVVAAAMTAFPDADLLPVDPTEQWSESA
jgi:DNA polymerase-3 subunit gamma/tau